MTDAIKRALRIFGNHLGNCCYDKEYLRAVKNPPKKHPNETRTAAPNPLHGSVNHQANAPTAMARNTLPTPQQHQQRSTEMIMTEEDLIMGNTESFDISIDHALVAPAPPVQPSMLPTVSPGRMRTFQPNFTPVAAQQLQHPAQYPAPSAIRQPDFRPFQPQQPQSTNGSSEFVKWNPTNFGK